MLAPILLPRCCIGAGLQEAEADLLRLMFEKYAYPCVEWVVEGVDGDNLVRHTKQPTVLPACHAAYRAACNAASDNLPLNPGHTLTPTHTFTRMHLRALHVRNTRPTRMCSRTNGCAHTRLAQRPRANAPHVCPPHQPGCLPAVPARTATSCVHRCASQSSPLASATSI